MNNKFEKYKQLKDQLNIQYKGIDLSRVMAVELWALMYERKYFPLKRIIYFFVSLNLRRLKTDKPILSTLGIYYRKDYFELYQNIIKKLEGQVTINELRTYNRTIRIHPRLILRYTKDILARLNNTDFSLIQKLLLAARFVHYINIVEDMQNVNFGNVSRYLAFSGIHPLENLFTQYLSNKNIKTYSLQHGISFLLKKDISIDALCYENFQSDVLLCWGQYTVDEYSRFGISKTKLTIAGYPKSIDCASIRKCNKYENCLVLLTRATYESSNKKLLDICQELASKNNIIFSLKLHPSLDIIRYKEYIANATQMVILDENKTLMSYLDNAKFDFAIAVNTSSYYEAQIRGIPCLRYNDGSFDQMYGMNDEFDSAEQFLNILNKLKEKSSESLEIEMKSLLEYAVGLGQDNYKELLL